MFLQGKRANDYENGNLVKFQKTKEKRKEKKIRKYISSSS